MHGRGGVIAGLTRRMRLEDDEASRDRTADQSKSANRINNIFIRIIENMLQLREERRKRRGALEDAPSCGRASGMAGMARRYDRKGWSRRLIQD